MKASESIAEISKALAAAWGSIENPKHNKKVTVKTKKGYTYDFEYTDLGGIIDEVKPHFSKNGIMITQHSYTETIENNLYIAVSTRLLHSSGEWMESKPMKILADGNIQDMGGQITYMKRYSLSAMLGISTEEDDDANGSLGNKVEGRSNKASDKQLDFVTNLINKKVTKELTFKVLHDGLKKRMKTDKDMQDWTTQQASQAIKLLQGDGK